ncbi:MAG: hypothetical protein HOY75_08210 [Streptomyces sp.]|nr:hypothetical protein [Streptomyces sp.]
MTGYLRAARICRAVALLAVLAALLLAQTGHPWWALLPGWVTVIAFLAGRFLNLGHNDLISERRRKETRTA